MNRCAIIGCGLIAGGYDDINSSNSRTHAKAFHDHPSCELVGVCDIDGNKAKNFADNWNIPYYTTSIENLLMKCNPDILSICTPTKTHLNIFELCCRMGVQIIWLEKPASSSLVEVKKMIEITKKYKTKVWLNYFRRYDLGFQKAKRKLSELGIIQHVQAYYTKGTLHNGSHMIDLIHWFFGDITDFIFDNSLSDNLFPSVSGILKTNKANIHLKALDYKKFELFELDIIGSKGRIKILDGGQQIFFENIIKSKYYEDYQNLNLQEMHNNSYGIVMLKGLKQGLNGEKMPGLNNEIRIHQLLLEIDHIST